MNASAHPSITTLVGSTTSRKRLAVFFSFVLSALLLVACTGVHLISDYDEETDKSLTALQRKTDDFIEALKKVSGTSDGAFSKHQDFYDEADRDLRQLEFRVGAIPKNSHTVQLVANIRNVLLGAGQCSAEGASLRDLHCIPANRDKGPSKTALEIAQRNINQTLSAALNLEIAKKQGLEQNK